ncbi:inositol monophosphatase [Candidatus Parcubacteria bacterium]|nr:inositol monophosphatase [Candidatus Parcubacteria bacterium]
MKRTNNREPTKDFLKEAIDYLSPLIKQAGEMSLKKWEKIEIVKYKDDRDVATKIEIEIEDFLRNKILSKWTKHGFWGEETERINFSSSFQWLIDPIDGTKYYINSAPFFQIHIALVFNDEPILGLIYNPISKQLFSASKGDGAFLNNKLILLKAPVSLNKAIVDLDFLGLTNKSSKERKWTINKVDKIMERTYRVRMTGGALNIYLVTGAIDAYVNFGYSKQQDLAARLIIMQEAGFKIERIETSFERKVLIVSREPILSELTEILENK